MTELYINEQRVDLYEGVPVAQTLQANVLAELRDRQTDFTNKFKVPINDTNKKILDHLATPGEISTKPHEQLTARLVYSGIEVVKNGYAHCSKSERDYFINIYSGNISLVKAIEGQNLEDLTTLPTVYANIAAVTASWSNTSGAIFALMDNGFGGVMDKAGAIGTYNVDYLAPCLFLHTIIDAIFSEASISKSGAIFSDAEYLNHVVMVGKGSEEEKLTAELVDRVTAESEILSVNNTAPFGSGVFVQEDQITEFINALSDPDNLIQGTLEEKIVIDNTGTHKLTLSIDNSDFTHFYGNPMNVNVKVNGILVSQTPIDVNGVGGGELLPTDIYLDLLAGDEVTFFADASSEPNGEDPIEMAVEYSLVLRIELDEAESDFGRKHDTAALLGEVAQIDVLKDFMQRWGLVYKVDREGVYHFEKMENILDPAALLPKVDWSAKYSGHKTQNFKSRYAQKNRFAYKYDDDTAPFADGFLHITDENLPAEKTEVTSIYKATKANSISVNNVSRYLIAPLWNIDEEGNEEPIEGPLRIFKLRIPGHTVRLKTTDSPTYVEPSETPRSAEFVHLGYQQIIDQQYNRVNGSLNRYRDFVALFHLTALDVYNFDPFKAVFVEQLGAYFYVNKIKNFVPGRLTEVSMIKENGQVCRFTGPGDIVGTETIGLGGKLINYDVEMSGECMGIFIIEQYDDTGFTDGDIFPVGTTVQRFRATDPVSGRVHKYDFTVTIEPL